MQRLSPEAWQEWQRSSITEAVMGEIKVRIEDAKNQLIGPSNDRDFDQFVKGMIRGFQEVLDVQLETFEEDSEDEIQAGDTGPSSNY